MSDAIKDGGSAYPRHQKYHTGEETFESGMSLRDWFAGQVLAGLSAGISTERFGDLFHGIQGGMKEAKVAYVIADAMLKVREGK